MICGAVWFQKKKATQQTAAEGDQPSEHNPSLSTGVPEEGGLVLCAKCFANGNFPNILSSGDFIKVDLLERLQHEQTGRGQELWSQEETLQLLDLITKYNDNWKEVQKYFPTRTKEDIVLHFLQLPSKNITSVNLLEVNELPDDQLPASERISEPEITCLNDYSNPLFHHVRQLEKLCVC